MPPEFGATPWGRSWTRTIEKTTAAGPNPLLPKARSIARNHGATLTIEVGVVTAKVVASGAEANVRIELPPWSEETEKDAERLIGKSLAANPGLAAGDLPDGLEADFTAAGITFAVPLDEQVATCDCRTRKRPCVHILATLYALSMRVDERPRLAVELRMDSAAVAEAGDPDWIPLTELDPGAFYG
ncbi:SWIM zinc finger family protein [Nocardia sp. CDC159]|uniref:SWIM zinc finger family protein n=1 Tax=Nocardia pulmonis TaxID=2951408 RepID=A0A9X2E594_9NOCA|nr:MULTISPECIES: SWIM zinc finger family protein [Nocardia]MCM6771868.1 SWIM zinc finger family protein [Nocardia pulmonis]MCM6785474.1 SWIM zinc finger family protein [Nocardia sp. CDC159]